MGLLPSYDDFAPTFFEYITSLMELTVLNGQSRFDLLVPALLSDMGMAMLVKLGIAVLAS